MCLTKLLVKITNASWVKFLLFKLVKQITHLFNQYNGPLDTLFTNAAHRCSPLSILSLSGVDRHDCLLPSLSVLCELWVELVLSQIAQHSVHPPQSGPSSMSLPSHIHCCYLLCNVRVFSPHHMAIPRKACVT